MLSNIDVRHRARNGMDNRQTCTCTVLDPPDFFRIVHAYAYRVAGLQFELVHPTLIVFEPCNFENTLRVVDDVEPRGGLRLQRNKCQGGTTSSGDGRRGRGDRHAVRRLHPRRYRFLLRRHLCQKTCPQNRQKKNGQPAASHFRPLGVEEIRQSITLNGPKPPGGQPSHRKTTSTLVSRCRLVDFSRFSPKRWPARPLAETGSLCAGSARCCRNAINRQGLPLEFRQREVIPDERFESQGHVEAPPKLEDVNKQVGIGALG